MSTLTLGHFRLQGWQDCNNACDLSELREVGLDAMRVELDGGRDEWIAQMPIADYEGLDPVACFTEWRDAWLATAEEILAEYASKLDPDEDREAIAICGLGTDE